MSAPTMYKFGKDEARIELGPPKVEMPCTDETLDNRVTHALYHIGGRDADGRLIRPEESDDPRVAAALEYDLTIGREPIRKGEPMQVLLWTKPSKWVWYIYKLERDQHDNAKFIKVGFEETREAAEARARAIVEGAE